MNRVLISAIAAASVVFASACGSSSSSDGGTASRPPTDRVLRLSFLEDPGQPPDPDIYYADQGLLLTTNTYEGLLQYKGGTDKPEIVGGLATKWNVSKDNKVFTFELRKGVKFHDGTSFTAAAVKPSFDRRLAVNQGPAYMVKDVASVTTKGDATVVIKLKASNPTFLSYLASAYGPKMMSPTALKEHAAKDHAQTYLRTHDVGTGPYTLTDAKTGSHYALKAFDGYWGSKPYFTSVDLPVVTNDSTQQLQLNKGQLAAILHGLGSSATASYRKNTALKNYSLPTLKSQYLYVNPRKGMLTGQANRTALLQGIDVDTIVKQVFAGRGTKSSQSYPPNMIAVGMAMQNIPHQPAGLQTLVKSLPADQKTLTLGYDSASSDMQIVANLISAQLSGLGLTVKVQAYPTSQVFGWVDDPKGAPELLLAGIWPDAGLPFTFAHIIYGSDGGLNYLHCQVPEIDKLLSEGERTGDDQIFAKVGELATASGCWSNIVDMNDFMVAQPWLKGVEQAHVVTAPETLSLAALSVG